MLFSSASRKLGEKPKAKKSKELKKIHILDCGFCCFSSRENMVMGKGPAWSQNFFVTLTLLAGVALNQYVAIISS